MAMSHAEVSRGDVRRVSPVQVDLALAAITAIFTVLAAYRVLFESHHSFVAQPRSVVTLVNWGISVLLAPMFLAVSWYLEERPLRAWARGWMVFALLQAARIHLFFAEGTTATGRLTDYWHIVLVLVLSSANNAFFFYSGMLAWDEPRATRWAWQSLALFMLAVLLTLALPTGNAPGGIHRPYHLPDMIFSIIALITLIAGQLRLLLQHLRRLETPTSRVRVVLFFGGAWVVTALFSQACLQILIPMLTFSTREHLPKMLESLIPVMTPILLLFYASTQPLLFLARKFSRIGLFLDQSLIAHFVVDSVGVTTETSAQELLTLGYFADDRLAGKPRAELFMEFDRWKGIADRVKYDPKSVFRSREALRRKDGTPVIVDLSVWQTPEQSIAGYYTDATDTLVEEALSQVLVNLSLSRAAGPDTLKGFIEGVRRATNACGVAVFVFEHGGKRLLLSATTGVLSQSAQCAAVDVAMLDEKNIDPEEVRVFEHTMSGSGCALCASPLRRTLYSEPYPICACVLLPFNAFGGPQGIIWIQHDQKFRMEKSHREQLDRFAHIASALLAEDVHLDLGDFHDDLARFDALASHADIDRMLRRLLDGFSHRVPVRRWVLAITVDDWRTRAVSSDAREAVPRADRPLEQGWSDLMKREGVIAQTVSANHRADVEQILAMFFDDDDEHGDSLVAVRVGIRDDVRAVLFLIDRNSTGFSRYDVALAERYADLLALVLASVALQHRVMSRWLKVAHEVSNPLTMIRAEVDEGLQQLTPSAHEGARCRLEAIDDYAVMLNQQLTQFEAFDAGISLVRNVRPTDLRTEVLDVVRRDIAPWLRGSGLPVDRLTFDIGDGIPPLTLDPEALQHALMNLLKNAIKYRAPEISDFRAVVRVHRIEDRVEISVEDQGMGVPEGWESRIFEKGQRAPNSDQRVIKGFGIGLAIVREVVEELGGTVTLRQLARPTTFVIALDILR